MLSDSSWHGSAGAFQTELPNVAGCSYQKKRLKRSVVQLVPQTAPRRRSVVQVLPQTAFG